MSPVTPRSAQAGSGGAAPPSALPVDDHIFGGYRNLGTYGAAFDEMFDRRGSARAPYKGIYAELAPTGTDELGARAEALVETLLARSRVVAPAGPIVWQTRAETTS